jgi:hypothetical protein
VRQHDTRLRNNARDAAHAIESKSESDGESGSGREREREERERKSDSKNERDGGSERTSERARGEAAVKIQTRQRGLRDRGKVRREHAVIEP